MLLETVIFFADHAMLLHAFFYIFIHAYMTKRLFIFFGQETFIHLKPHNGR